MRQRTFIIPGIASLLVLVAFPLHAMAAPRNEVSPSASSGITMRVQTGWGGRYRDAPAWAPVRVSLSNTSNNSLGGSVQIRDDAVGATIGSQSLVARYQQPVVLPAGGRKQLSLYLPGADVGNQVNVSFVSSGRVVATGTSFPARFPSGQMTVGIFTRDPANTTWISQLRLKGRYSVVPIPLTPSTVDPVPEVLSTFDLIVLADADTSSLDRDQMRALERYVRNGGSLLEIGGPDWAGTIRPLPAALVPGQIASSETLRTFAALETAGSGKVPRGSGTVSVLSHPKGAVLVSQKSLPLVIRSRLGNGVVDYWAFDPSLMPFTHWPAAARLLGRLTGEAVPQAMRRISLPTGYDSASFLEPPSGPFSVNSELESLPASSLRTLILIALVVLYVLLAGPLIVTSLRRIGRSGFTWAAIPALALTFTGATVGVASTVKTSGSVMNSVGMLEMDGTGDQYPLDLYTEVSAPTRTFHYLTYDALAVTQPLLGDDSLSLAQDRSSWLITEGSSTGVGFTSTGDSGLDTFSFRTSASIGGTIHADLHLSGSGVLVGTIQNETGMRLNRPAVIAGRTFEHLPDLPPGGLVRVHLLPQNDPHHHSYSQTLFRIYGGFRGDDKAFGQNIQTGLDRRIQNAVGALPETNIVSMLGEVSLVGWAGQPLGRLQLDGKNVNGEGLTMIVKPLALATGIGSFRLREGSVGAYLVDQTPAVATYACCGPSPYAVYIGNGGDATFEFDLPMHAGTHYRSLTFSIYGGGPDASYNGYRAMARGSAEAFDWKSQKWVTLDFHHDDASLPGASRFVAPSGALLVKLLVHSDSHELTITDPRQDLQISGTAGAG